MKKRYVSILAAILVAGLAVHHFGWNNLVDRADVLTGNRIPVSYTHLTLPTKA